MSTSKNDNSIYNNFYRNCLRFCRSKSTTNNVLNINISDGSGNVFVNTRLLSSVNTLAASNPGIQTPGISTDLTHIGAIANGTQLDVTANNQIKYGYRLGFAGSGNTDAVLIFTVDY